MRELRFRRFWSLAGLALVLGTLVVCLTPATGAQPVFRGVDKLEHAAAYFVLTSWFAALMQRRHYGWVVVAMLLLGLSIEVAQQLMGLGRVADWRDLLANGTGVAAGLIVALASRESWFARIERWLAPA
jgi:VanZ family protein